MKLFGDETQAEISEIEMRLKRLLRKEGADKRMREEIMDQLEIWENEIEMV